MRSNAKFLTATLQVLYNEIEMLNIWIYN